MPTPQRWDIFCRVVDNLGDAGVCWRLAADLAMRGLQVRLVIDDTAPLALIAPQGCAGVEVLHWPAGSAAAQPADVVIEAFGCNPPPAYVAAMESMPAAPLWINLEYLSAEGYVERSHGLPSPQRSGLVKHFYFPGYTARTGGLLREPGLMAARAAFDRAAWLRAHGIGLQAGERIVSMFCYDNALLPQLLANLAQQPTLLLAAQGAAQRQLDAIEHAGALPRGLRAQRLPWLAQADFDRLLWSCELNVVRGEDSLVRAIWAGAPFIWQAYPQHGGAQHAKVDALLTQMGAAPAQAALWRAWNAAPGAAWPGLPPLAAWQASLAAWRESLLAQADLVTRLQSWVRARC